MITLYGRLIRLHARLLLSIGAGIALFELFMVWFGAQVDRGAGFQVLLDQFLPPAMREMIYSQLGMATFEGTVAFGYQHPLFLVAVIAFTVTAGTVPASERETGFLDLVLARPVRRSTYFLATLLLVLTGAIVLPLSILAGVVAGLATVDAVPADVSWNAYLPATAYLALLLLAVGGLALLAAAGEGRRGTAAGKVAGLILVFYWLDFMGPLWDPLEQARWLSPFTYFNPAGSVAGGLAARDVAVLLGVFSAASVAALLEFGRQDL